MYEFGRDRRDLRGKGSVYILSKTRSPFQGDAYLTRPIPTEHVKGRAVVVQVYVFARDLSGPGRANFLVQTSVQGPVNNVERTYRTPISYTGGWSRQEFKLMLPKDLAGLHIGVSLDGPGHVKIGDITLKTLRPSFAFSDEPENFVNQPLGPGEGQP